MKEWGISHIPIIITDNGSNMVKAFKEAKSSYSSDLIDQTIEQVATNTIRREPAPAIPQQQHEFEQHSTTGDEGDLSVVEDFVMWKNNEVDTEESHQEHNQATESETEGNYHLYENII